MNRTILMITLALSTTPALSQQMYKCPDPAGVVNFQQMPCTPTGGGEAVEKKAIQSTGTSMMSDSARSYLADAEKSRAAQDAAQAEEDRRQEALSVERGKVRAAREQAAAQRATAAAIWATGRR